MIDYKLEIKPENKHVYLVIREGKLIVRANNQVPLKEIEQLINKKTKWILKHLKKSKEFEAKKPKKDELIYYLGSCYPLHIKESTVNFVSLSDQAIIIQTLSKDESYCAELLDEFYKTEAVTIIEKLLNKWVVMMKVSPQKISYRKLKSRWGSCSYRNNLSFNTQLAHLPVEVIEYVVVHELAHIIHKNHSAQFWQLVYDYLPKAPQLRKLLRAYEKKINL